MEKLKRKHWKVSETGKREFFEAEYFVATQAEADKLKWQYKIWYDCQPGDMAVTDDGYVFKCLTRQPYKSRATGNQTVLLTFAAGRMFATFKPGKDRPHQRFLYEPRRQTGEFGSVSTQPWYELKKGRQRTKEFVKAYVFQRLSSGKVDHEMLGKMWEPTEPMPAVKARSLLKKRYIREMISKEMKKFLVERSIDEGAVLDLLLLAAKIAKTKADAANINRAAENLMKILHMTDGETKGTSFEGEYVEASSIDEVERLDAEQQLMLEESEIMEERENGSKEVL